MILLIVLLAISHIIGCTVAIETGVVWWGVLSGTALSSLFLFAMFVGISKNQ